MGYLDLSSYAGDDFDKAIISLWFRVSQDSINAVEADYEARTNSQDFPFVGLLPFFTFGSMGTVHFHDAATNFTSDTYTSFVGARCTGGSDEISGNIGSPPAALQVYLNYDHGGYSGSPYWPDQHDFFCVGGYMEAAWELSGPVQTASYVEITPDVWHHALISFDVSSGCTMAYGAGDGPINFIGNCQFWWALDDVNYNGDYLSPYSPRCFENGVGGDNQIVSAISTSSGTGADGTGGYSFSAGPVPASGHPMGTPNSSEHEKYVYHCELAELQLFTGITIDTSSVANRRYFIDGDGKPVSPTKVASDADPSSGSIEGLGQRPDVLLHRSSNWISGANTGKTGVDADGKPIPAGQFSPTGDIKKYTPDPSLYGPQSPSSRSAVRLAKPSRPVQLTRPSRPAILRPPRPRIIRPPLSKRNLSLTTIASR